MQDKSISNGNGKLRRALGLWPATAIVIGNMIGSGIFTSPQSLAAGSNPTASLIAWAITSIGSLCVALVFARLGVLNPCTGGPVVYTRMAFGEFSSFLIAWTFWIGMWVGNAAIITAIVRYSTVFFPILKENGLLAFLFSSAILWFFTLINIKGVKEAGVVSIITTLSKVITLLIIMVIAFRGFDSDNLNTVANPEHQGFGTIPVAVAITLWAYIGLESASLTGGEIKNPNRNVQRSTIIGFSITAVLYILTAVATMGSLPQEKLAHAAAPMSDIINHITGARWGGWFVALGVIIAASGTISGWVLTTARTAFAAGEERLFPSFFARVHPHFATPNVSLIISGILTNLLLSLNYVQSLTEAFDFLILLATLTFMPAYSFSATALILLDNKGEKPLKKIMIRSIIPLLGFIYCIYATYSAGATMAMYGFLLMLSGIPVFVFMKLKRSPEK